MDKVIKNFQNISYGPAPEDSKEVNSWIKNLKNLIFNLKKFNTIFINIYFNFISLKIFLKKNYYKL